MAASRRPITSTVAILGEGMSDDRSPDRRSAFALLWVAWRKESSAPEEAEKARLRGPEPFPAGAARYCMANTAAKPPTRYLEKRPITSPTVRSLDALLSAAP